MYEFKKRVIVPQAPIGRNSKQIPKRTTQATELTEKMIQKNLCITNLRIAWKKQRFSNHRGTEDTEKIGFAFRGTVVQAWMPFMGFASLRPGVLAFSFPTPFQWRPRAALDSLRLCVSVVCF
jgi:hypothetical protein